MKHTCLLTRINNQVHGLMGCFLLLAISCSGQKETTNKTTKQEPIAPKVTQMKGKTLADSSDAYWKKTLSPEAYAILRKSATERPHTGAYNQLWDTGVYQCGGCGTSLFYSNTKFDAGCGWPSFFQAIDSSKIQYLKDNELGYERTEIRCSTCGGHLGHVFDDGPPPTGLRYCLNSGALKFVPRHKDE